MANELSTIATTSTGRAGRNLPAAFASAFVLLGVIAASLLLWKVLFLAVIVVALIVGSWELHHGLAHHNISLPQYLLPLLGTIMVVGAYFWGAPALLAATAISALIVMTWLLSRGIDGFVRNASATVMALIYLPFLGSFVALMLAEGGAWDARGLVGGRLDDGVAGIIIFIIATIASDIGGYTAGVLFGRTQMAPNISPKKSWEGLAGSFLFSIGAGVGMVAWLFPDNVAWIGLALGVIAATMATIGDLIASVMKRDLGIKDMSQIIPGHGGLMDRLDSLLATIAPIWLLLHYLVFTT